MPTDFAMDLKSYFSSFLPGTKNLRTNTILSYRDTFRLFLIFCSEVKNIDLEKIDYTIISPDLIISYLEWLEKDRGCSISTRNQRLFALHSFFRYVQVREPEQLHLCQQILQINHKKCQPPIVNHLSIKHIEELLSLPNISSKLGRRDLTLLSVLYDTAARVQELCDIRLRDIRLDHPAIISLTGKGNKTRHVPILGNTIKLLQSYINEYKFLQNKNLDIPLFFNQQHTKLTRNGVSYILKKYANILLQRYPNMALEITPHVLRHSKAMHLYQANINLVYIRDILGHADISTTDIYARADTETKRKALESVYKEITIDTLPEWNHEDDLMTFLTEL